MKEENETILGCITAIVCFLAVVPVVIFKGYVLSILWRWFIVTQFHLQPLGIAQAIGVSLALNYLIADHVNPDCEEKERTSTEKMLRALLMGFGRPTIALLAGWIVKAWL